MGTLCIDLMFSFTDSNVETDSEGRCTNRKFFVVYLSVSELIGQAYL